MFTFPIKHYTIHLRDQEVPTKRNLETRKEIKMTNTTYMNIETGSTGIYAEWWYVNNEGEMVNAVDLNEVIEVEWDEAIGYWTESSDLMMTKNQAY